MSGKWGIEQGSGWYEWEETRLSRSKTHETQVSDNATTPADLLVDVKGKPLIQRQPRKVGFRPPEVDPE